MKKFATAALAAALLSSLFAAPVLAEDPTPAAPTFCIVFPWWPGCPR